MCLAAENMSSEGNLAQSDVEPAESPAVQEAADRAASGDVVSARVLFSMGWRILAVHRLLAGLQITQSRIESFGSHLFLVLNAELQV